MKRATLILAAVGVLAVLASAQFLTHQPRDAARLAVSQQPSQLAEAVAVDTGRAASSMQRATSPALSPSVPSGISVLWADSIKHARIDRPLAAIGRAERSGDIVDVVAARSRLMQCNTFVHTKIGLLNQGIRLTDEQLGAYEQIQMLCLADSSVMGFERLNKVVISNTRGFSKLAEFSRQIHGLGSPLSEEDRISLVTEVLAAGSPALVAESLSIFRAEDLYRVGMPQSNQLPSAVDKPLFELAARKLACEELGDCKQAVMAACVSTSICAESYDLFIQQFLPVIDPSQRKSSSTGESTQTSDLLQSRFQEILRFAKEMRRP